VFIISVQGIVYIIDEDYSYDRDIRNYITSGSGGDFAQGSLFQAAKTSPRLFTDIEYAKKAMTTAIDASREFDVHSGGETRIYVQEA
jgi:hypothetical protein